MKILVLGQGGREHALVKAFLKSPLNPVVHCLPGNDGIATEALCFATISLDQKNEILQHCLNEKYDFVFFGSEDPLVNGLSDLLRQNNIFAVGPSQYWAQLEGSKIFAKKFMTDANIPTARYKIVSSVEEVQKYFSEFTPPYVLKADGLAAGKGVFICPTVEDLLYSADQIFNQKQLGPAGSIALLEQFSLGWELSYLLFTNGKDYVPLPIAQDHKRLFDNQKGPNTGGMGTWAPLKISDELNQRIINTIVLPSVKKLSEHQSPYWGVLFIGIMVHDDQPTVLEFNVRLGDPETQSILPLIKSDLATFSFELAQGKLGQLDYSDQFATCVVLASPGYPDSPQKGLKIEGMNRQFSNSLYPIFAGVKIKNETWFTNGGRVLGCVGIGASKNDSILKAYDLAKSINWPGIHFRTDIGKD